jgi:hypothetical protein
MPASATVPATAAAMPIGSRDRGGKQQNTGNGKRRHGQNTEGRKEPAHGDELHLRRWSLNTHHGGVVANVLRYLSLVRFKAPAQQQKQSCLFHQAEGPAVGMAPRLIGS